MALKTVARDWGNAVTVETRDDYPKVAHWNTRAVKVTFVAARLNISFS